MSGSLWTGLLEFYRGLEPVPDAARREATLFGVRAESPTDHNAQVLSAFLETYCQELTPAGVLLVDGGPTPAGAGRTGIPLTDERRARDVLGLDVRGEASDPRCDLFWQTLGAARERVRGRWEDLFSTVHLASACPFVLTDGAGEPAHPRDVLPRAPTLRETSLARLDRVARILRPQVIVPIGRLAFEAVASIARNRHELAATLALGWDEIPGRHRGGLRGGLRAEFPRFRARILPLRDLDERGAPDARAALEDVLVEAWVTP